MTYPISHLRLYRANAKRDGYVLLLSVLLISAVAAVVLPSLLFLGINSGQVGATIGQSAQALAAAQACAEYGLLRLKETVDYPGNEVLSLNGAACALLPVGGMGNDHRLLCSEGQAGDTIRRLEIIVNQVSPRMVIDSWQEVSSFSLCL
ncbi:MAG: hypothetical protein PHZ00_05290 [Candidatus Peribacteraceae bacterium]|nr:hypothetical protein [Candidatus Peribacteraceae bacterium]